jgi:hypothetical protein
MKNWTPNELQRQRRLWNDEQKLNECRVRQAYAYPGVDPKVARFNADYARQMVERIDAEIERRGA